MIYLDNAATTPIAPEVINAMHPYLETHYGNPSAKHYSLAEMTWEAISNAREKVAALINACPSEVAFTSSASESNNFILKGILDTNPKKHLITTAAEHSSSFETAKYLESKGARVTYLPIADTGQVSVDGLRNAICKDTALISVNWVNSEVGTIAPVGAIASICQDAGVPLHLDATQAIGKLTVDTKNIPVSYLSFSAHKIYGPKGIGGCYINNTAPRPTPLIHGGGQEGGLRAGTLAVHNIVGFGEAALQMKNQLVSDVKHIKYLENRFIEHLAAKLPKAIIYTAHSCRIDGLVSLMLPGINNEILLNSLANEVALSTGSACSSTKPSRVLLALGYTLEEVRNTIRISIGRYNTPQEIDTAVALLVRCSERLSIF